MSDSFVEPVVPAEADALAADPLDNSVITVCTSCCKKPVWTLRACSDYYIHKSLGLKFGRTEAPGLKSRIMDGWKSIDGSIEGWKLVNGSMEVRP